MTVEHLRSLKTLLESIEDLPDFAEVDREKAQRNFARSIKRIGAAWPTWFTSKNLEQHQCMFQPGVWTRLRFSYAGSSKVFPRIISSEFQIEFYVSGTKLDVSDATVTAFFDDEQVESLMVNADIDDITEYLKKDLRLARRLETNINSWLHRYDIISPASQLSMDHFFSDLNGSEIAFVSKNDDGPNDPYRILHRYLHNQLEPFFPVLDEIFRSGNGEFLHSVLAKAGL